MSRRQCEAFWNEFVASLAPGDPRRQAKPDAFAFGGEGPLGEELATLVLAGQKRATTSLPIEYTSLNEPLPKTGDLSIIVNGSGIPVAIIERTSVNLVPFQDVDAEFAAYEGEGDGSLEYWREAHTEYFGAVCKRLMQEFTQAMPVICQRFRVVWR